MRLRAPAPPRQAAVTCRPPAPTRLRAPPRASPADAAPPSPDDAAAVLGVDKDAAFDAIVAKKEALVADAKRAGDAARVAEVEAAYDALLMRSMQRRLAGGVADPAVRFADVRRAAPARVGGGGGASTSRSPTATRAPPSAAASLPGGLKLAPAPPALLAKAAACYGGLAAWALAQALTEPPAAAAVDGAGAQTAVALLATLYFLRDGKKLALPQAGAVAGVALLAGVAAGAALNAWLRVDVVPLGSFAAPGVLTAEAAIGALFAVAALVE